MKLVLHYLYIQFIIAKNHTFDLMLSIINFLVSQATSFIFINIIDKFLHGFSTIIISIDAFLFSNIATVEQKVNHGNFDIFLIKPQGVLFQIIFEKNSISDFFCAAFGVIYILISSVHVEFNIFLFFGGIVLSLAIVFFVKLLIVSTTFWTNSSFTVYVTFQNLLSFGKYPLSIFGHIIQIIWVSIVPVGLVSSIPVMMALNKLPAVWFLYSLMILLLFAILALLAWKKGLAKYQCPGN